MKRNRLFRYVPHHMIAEMKTAGWIVKRPLEGSHGEYCVLMEYRP